MPVRWRAKRAIREYKFDSKFYRTSFEISRTVCAFQLIFQPPNKISKKPVEVEVEKKPVEVEV
jgi:hypothetical protein